MENHQVKYRCNSSGKMPKISSHIGWTREGIASGWDHGNDNGMERVADLEFTLKRNICMVYVVPSHGLGLRLGMNTLIQKLWLEFLLIKTINHATHGRGINEELKNEAHGFFRKK
jgi:hypothetical protein